MFLLQLMILLFSLKKIFKIHNVILCLLIFAYFCCYSEEKIINFILKDDLEI